MWPDENGLLLGSRCGRFSLGSCVFALEHRRARTIIFGRIGLDVGIIALRVIVVRGFPYNRNNGGFQIVNFLGDLLKRFADVIVLGALSLCLFEEVPYRPGQRMRCACHILNTACDLIRRGALLSNGLFGRP